MSYSLEFTDVLAYAGQFAAGAGVTLRLSVFAMVLGLVIAIPFAQARANGPPLLRRAIGIYVEFVRNTPLLVQVYLVFFGLPSLGLRLSPNSAALVAMVLNVSAYATEIVRAGIQSIDRGQVEAARALGLRGQQIFRLVTLRPAIKNVYPALTSQFIILMLFSSLISAISADDLTSVAAHVQSVTFRSFEVYILVTAIYFLLSSGLSAMFAWIYRSYVEFPTR